MGEIKTAADDTFRDYVTEGIPATGANDPAKSEIRDVFDIIDEKVGNVEGTVTSGRKAYETYAALAASSAPAVGTVGEVPPSDAGTHTDPVVGGTVANSGVYRYSTSPAGWLRIYDYPVLTMADDGEAEDETEEDKAVNPKQLGDLRARVMEQAGRALWAFDWQLPGEDRPGKAIRVQEDRAVIDLRPADSAYRDSYERHYNDIVRIEMIDAAVRWHGRPVGEHIWIPTSMMSRFAGQWVEHINFSWNDVLGLTTNNGQVPALWGAPAFFIGPVSAGYAAIEAGGGSGPLHGHIEQAAGMGITTTGGVRQAAAIVDGTNIRDIWERMEVIEFETLTFDQQWSLLSHNGGYTAATMNIAHTFDPNAGHQMASASSTQIATSPATGITTGVAEMIAFRLANRIQAKLKDNSLSAVWTVGLGDDHLQNIGDAKRVTGWHTDFPGHALEMELPADYIQFQRNGSEATAPAFQIKDEVSGPKVRAYTHAGGGVLTTETGNLISQTAYYNAVRADGA